MGAETLEIFNNLKKVTIDTTWGNKEYRFNLESFLSSIQSSKPSITYIIRANSKYKGDGLWSESWLKDIITPSLQKAFNDKGWKLSQSKEFNDDGQHLRDCLIINKY